MTTPDLDPQWIKAAANNLSFADPDEIADLGWKSRETLAKAALEAAAPLIAAQAVAAERERIAQALLAEADRLIKAHWGVHGIGYRHAARWLTDPHSSFNQPDAIARTGGDSGTRDSEDRR